MKSTNNMQIQAVRHNGALANQADQTPIQPELIMPYAPALAQAPPADSASVAGLFRELWRNRGLLAGTAALGLLAALVAAVLSSPSYQSRVTLQLEGFSNDAFYRSMAPAAAQFSGTPAENQLQNQVALLRSDTLARRVAEKLRIGAPPKPSWTQPLLEPVRRLAGQLPLPPEQARLKVVQNSLTVNLKQNSEVLELLYSAPTPAMAAQGANAVAEEFIALNREHRDAMVSTASEWLGQQTSELKRKLETASQALQGYATHSGIVFSGPEEGSTLAKERMRRLEESFSAAQADRASKQSRLEAASNPKHEVLPDALMQASYRQSANDLQNLRRQLADMKTLFTPAHQKVKSLEAQIAELERALAQEKSEAIGRLRTEYLAAAGLEVRLAAAHADQLRTLQSQAAMSAHYNLLKREVETMQQVYDLMLQKEKEASMAAALRATNVRVIDRAQPPSSPHSPNLPLYLSLGFALGSFGGLCLVALRDKGDRLLRPGDTADYAIPELGAIPSARLDPVRRGLRLWPLRLGGRSEPLELVTWNETGSLLSESFRATLASILFRVEMEASRARGAASKRGRKFVFTSVEPVEGKTTVATNLAIALAETHKRVLLIDADLRRPRLHEVFDVCNDWGLTSLLEGAVPGRDAPIEALARATHIPDLWLLPSGPGTANVSRLLHSGCLEDLLQRLASAFDLVLIDSPPMETYSDARVFGHLSDGVVLVVRANKTGRESLRSACVRLMQDGIPILGTVLNDWSIQDSARSNAYYYRYKAR